MRSCVWTLLFCARTFLACCGARRTHSPSKSDPAGVEVTKARGAVPPILHQSWKDRTLQPRQAVWRKSWQEMNPTWSTLLWTDQANRNLVSDHYPWLLDVFDNLKGVHQADMVSMVMPPQPRCILIGLSCKVWQGLCPLQSAYPALLAHFQVASILR